MCQDKYIILDKVVPRGNSASLKFNGVEIGIMIVVILIVKISEKVLHFIFM